MTSDPRPMDPERLAEIREWAERPGSPINDKSWYRELLAHVEWQAREIERSTKALNDGSAEMLALGREVAQLRTRLEREIDDARAFNKRTTDALGELFVTILGEDAPGGGPLESKVERLRSMVDEACAQLCDADDHTTKQAGSSQRLFDDLVAARREIARLRSRVQVTAEDVERAGVTPAKFAAWCEANGKLSEGANTANRIAYMLGGWWTVAPADQWRILDEMAAMPDEGEVKP